MSKHEFNFDSKSKPEPTDEFSVWLQENCFEVDFFQAARLLYIEAARNSGVEDDYHSLSLDNQPQQEHFRFRALPSLSHPANEVQIQKSTSNSTNVRLDDRESIIEVLVSFMGLTGPSGVLPHHYTEMLCDRIRNHDFALRDFFDLFNHRLISLFYRAWKKYRLPFSFEFSHLDERTESDPISDFLYSLVGMNTGGLRNRQGFSDSAFAYYSGSFASQIPTAVELESIINDHFGVEAKLIQYQPDVLFIEKEDQTRLGMPSALGQTTIVGERVTTIENRFRVCIGPCTIKEFRALTPAGKNLNVLGQFIRSYVGISYDFDVQVILRKEDIPKAELGGIGSDGCRLGWDTWINFFAFNGRCRRGRF